MSGKYAASRRAAIKEAAFEVLAEKGYKAASVLEIAKRAGSSNETLYKWFGNKQGLFRTLVEDNAGQARALLESTLAEGGDALEALARLGPILLTIVTGEKAVALNRAAAGDVFETATLGPTIAQNGRDSILPLLTAIFEKADRDGSLAVADPEDAAETFINLLIGDLQIRRVIGVVEMPTSAEMAARTDRALSKILRIYRTG
ncbi:TetR/AcrR family transcriptional regulator [Oricola thermophila]|uniref:TetR/AcrR family transcriptional regulator n=1 Tax=Oricola thermophila TaxID=2742145 RepID=A0A6N1VL97_9HYPH|nr:TetR/AcrR family transcriptional regulator [Oricola thermophila]QKV19727.1 TetR/AcrR family transcriptional regulator [Oricola thermophila]